jgi:hypothetical protein
MAKKAFLLSVIFRYSEILYTLSGNLQPSVQQQDDGFFMEFSKTAGHGISIRVFRTSFRRKIKKGISDSLKSRI